MAPAGRQRGCRMPTNRTRRIRTRRTASGYPGFWNDVEPRFRPPIDEVITFFAYGWGGFPEKWSDLDLFSLTADCENFRPYWESIRQKFMREWKRDHPDSMPFIVQELDGHLLETT